MKKWSPRKGLKLITRLALRKEMVGVGMEHGTSCYAVAGKAGHGLLWRAATCSCSSGLLSVSEPWSVREFCKCLGNFCTVWSPGNPGTVLCKPSDIKGIKLELLAKFHGTISISGMGCTQQCKGEQDLGVGSRRRQECSNCSSVARGWELAVCGGAARCVEWCSRCWNYRGAEFTPLTSCAGSDARLL